MKLGISWEMLVCCADMGLEIKPVTNNIGLRVPSLPKYNCILNDAKLRSMATGMDPQKY